MATWKKLVHESSSGQIAQNAASSTTTSGIDITDKLKYESDVLTAGIDSSGIDVKFFGDDSGKYLEWDASNNTLSFVGGAQISPGESLTMSGATSILLAAGGDLSLSAAADIDITSAVSGSLTFTNDNGVAFKVDGDGDIEVGTDDNDSSIQSQGTSRSLILSGGGSGVEANGTAHIKLYGQSNGNIGIKPGGTGNVTYKGNIVGESGSGITLLLGDISSTATNNGGFNWQTDEAGGDGYLKLGESNSGPDLRIYGDSGTEAYWNSSDGSFEITGELDVSGRTDLGLVYASNTIFGSNTTLSADFSGPVNFDGDAQLSSFSGTSYTDVNPYVFNFSHSTTDEQYLQFVGNSTKTISIRMVDGSILFGESTPANATITSAGVGTFSSVSTSTLTVSSAFTPASVTTSGIVEGASLKATSGLKITGDTIYDDSDVASMTVTAGQLTIPGDFRINGNDIKASDGNTAITLSSFDVEVAGDLTINNKLTLGTNLNINGETSNELHINGPRIVHINTTEQVTALVSGSGSDSILSFYELSSPKWYIGMDADDGYALKMGVNSVSVGTNVKFSVDAVGNSTMRGALTVTGNVIKGSAGTAAITIDGNNITLAGDLTVNGTETIINSTTLAVDDKNLVLGVVDTPTDATAHQGGITLQGDLAKTIWWENNGSMTSNQWVMNQNLNLTSSIFEYRIGYNPVLSMTTLSLGEEAGDPTQTVLTFDTLDLDGAVLKKDAASKLSVGEGTNQNLVLQGFDDTDDVTSVIYFKEDATNTTNRDWNIHHRFASTPGQFWLEYQVKTTEHGAGLNSPATGWYHPIRVGKKSSSDAILIGDATWDDSGALTEDSRVDMPSVGLKDIVYKGGLAGTITLDAPLGFHVDCDLDVSGDAEISKNSGATTLQIGLGAQDVSIQNDGTSGYLELYALKSPTGIIRAISHMGILDVICNYDDAQGDVRTVYSITESGVTNPKCSTGYDRGAEQYMIAKGAHLTSDVLLKINMSGDVEFQGSLDLNSNTITNCNGIEIADGEDGLSLDGGGTVIYSFKDEDDMSSNDAGAVASQQSIKAYVDAHNPAHSLNDLTDVTYSSGDLTITSLDKISTAGVLNIVTGGDLTFEVTGDIKITDESDLYLYNADDSHYIKAYHDSDEFYIKSEAANIVLAVSDGKRVEFEEDGKLGFRHDASTGSTKFTHDSNNYCEIEVLANGVTTLSTLDASIDSEGHLSIIPDGNLEFSTSNLGKSAYFKDTAAGFERQETVAAPTTEIDFRKGNKHHLDIVIYSGITVNVKFPLFSGNFVLVIQQDDPGGRTVTTWGAKDSADNLCNNDGGTAGAIRWAGGTAPTLSTAANARDIIAFYWDADEEVCYGMPSLDFS